MKLLLDQNISYRVLIKINQSFPNSAQLKRLGLESTPDIEIWKYAKSNGFTIVTFDADFSEISSLKGHPPKIIWLRFGNNTTNFIAERLNFVKDQIEEFVNGEDSNILSCLEIL